MTPLLKSICDHEGFRPLAYPDPLTKGAPYTFGHGLTSITETESMEIVKNRVASIVASLSLKLPFWKEIPDDAKEVLIEMAYQMGVSGLLEFKKTLYAVKIKDYIGASKQMLTSLWAKQTPKRAQTLAKKMAMCLHQK